MSWWNTISFLLNNSNLKWNSCFNLSKIEILIIRPAHNKGFSSYSTSKNFKAFLSILFFISLQIQYEYFECMATPIRSVSRNLKSFEENAMKIAYILYSMSFAQLFYLSNLYTLKPHFMRSPKKKRNRIIYRINTKMVDVFPKRAPHNFKIA